jgi:hypothetical protein
VVKVSQIPCHQSNIISNNFERVFRGKIGVFIGFLTGFGPNAGLVTQKCHKVFRVTSRKTSGFFVLGRKGIDDGTGLLVKKG